MGNTTSQPEAAAADGGTTSALGLLALATPAHYACDVVFVHGLNGDRTRSWTNDAGVLWPQAWFAPDLPTARVLTFGYPNGLSFWQANGGRMTLRERAKNFLFDLENHDVGTGFHRQRDIIIGPGGANFDVNRLFPIGNLAQLLDLDLEVVGTSPVGMAARRSLIDAQRKVAHLGDPVRYLLAQ